MSRNPLHLVQWSIGESWFCNVISKRLEVVLCAHIVFLFPEQGMHQVFGEGALASCVASVLQWEKLIKEGTSLLKIAQQVRVFPDTFICPVLHLCPQTSQLGAKVPLCQTLWPGPRLIFRGGALVSPSSPCSVRRAAMLWPGPPAVFPFPGSKYYVESSKFQMGQLGCCWLGGKAQPMLHLSL